MNTIANIAGKINAFADQFKITPEAVDVTSYQQMGPNVRVYYKLNLTIGKTPEQIAKMAQKVRLLNELIADPFSGSPETEEPEIITKPVTDFDVSVPSQIYIGQNFTVSPTFLPADADDKTFTVTVSEEGIVSVLNGGTLITGLTEGNVVLTFSANGGDVADVIKLLSVEASRIIATPVSTDFTGNIANVNDQFIIDTEVFSASGDQNVIITVTDPTIIQKDADTFTCIGLGECLITIVSASDPTLSTSLTISVQA